MSDTRALRRRPISAYVVILLALGVIGVAYAALAPSGRAESSAVQKEDVLVLGNDLYLQGCSSCHGLKGQGTKVAPSLLGVGAAAVDFQVGTGRMPLALRGPQSNVKRQRYSPEEINALAQYVQSLGGGPPIPSEADLDTSGTSVSQGGEQFRTNCASCHNFTGEGGALTHGAKAPSLNDTTPKHIYEAMISGPGNMPVFGDKSMSPENKRAIINYVTSIRTQADPGGNGLGRVGPVTETIVAWVAGIGLLVAAAWWVGARV